MHDDRDQDEARRDVGRRAALTRHPPGGVGLDDGDRPPGEQRHIEHDERDEEPDVEQVGEDVHVGKHEQDGRTCGKDQDRQRQQPRQDHLPVVGLTQPRHDE